ncbi:MAG: neutral zinc metallopeptidase [Pseudomonadota bacterium]
MRLNPFDTSKIDVRAANQGGGRGRRAGGVGCGAIVIALIGAVVFGIDPSQTLAVLGGMEQTTTSAPASPTGVNEQAICSSGPYASEACAALTNLNETWEPEFNRAGIAFRQPFLQFVGDAPIRTGGCGTTTSAVGPFYCPADYGIYIDVRFFDQLARMSGTRGDFARIYVMAHEYAHHVQNLTGLADQVRQLKQRNPQAANRLSVAMELQADCYAGVWAGKNRALIEPGDIEEGMRAASAVGDDTIARQSGQRINPESFSHGSSRQRVEALQRGLQSGNSSACDIYFE